MKNAWADMCEAPAYVPTAEDLALEDFIAAGRKWLQAVDANRLLDCEPNPMTLLMMVKAQRLPAMAAYLDAQRLERARAG